jgi:hypothetical protein
MHEEIASLSWQLDPCIVGSLVVTPYNQFMLYWSQLPNAVRPFIRIALVTNSSQLSPSVNIRFDSRIVTVSRTHIHRVLLWHAFRHKRLYTQLHWHRLYSVLLCIVHKRYRNVHCFGRCFRYVAFCDMSCPLQPTHALQLKLKNTHVAYIFVNINVHNTCPNVWVHVCDKHMFHVIFIY